MQRFESTIALFIRHNTIEKTVETYNKIGGNQYDVLQCDVIQDIILGNVILQEVHSHTTVLRHTNYPLFNCKFPPFSQLYYA